MVCGAYVRTFVEASHALPQSMHMNADYPFMLPPIVSLANGQVTLAGSGGERVTAPVERDAQGEYCWIGQTSSFEQIFGQPSHRFQCRPFKDERTPAAGEVSRGQ